MNGNDKKACPYCCSLMSTVHVITSGGVWFCDSKEYLEYHIGGDADADPEQVRELNKEHPIRCVINSSGYTKGHGNWPKEGLYCEKCGAIVIKTRPTPVVRFSRDGSHLGNK